MARSTSRRFGYAVPRVHFRLSSAHFQGHVEIREKIIFVSGVRKQGGKGHGFPSDAPLACRSPVQLPAP